MTLHQHLNKQVANLAVLFIKLHHYHWYVKGSEFFSLHEKFEELYEEVNELYDTFAERLISINGNPASNMKTYLSLTSLKEATESKTPDMLSALINDLKLLVDELKELLDVSQKNNDEPTADLAITTIASLEKHIWMFSATAAK